MELLERVFHLKERQTTTGREVLGRITTFMALSCIILVQPAMLMEAGTPDSVFPAAGILVATCVGIALGFIAYNSLKLATCRGREVHWGFHVMALALPLRYVM
jgi:AGZA family xanthine/uracil permease-like MFS transporter